MRRVPLIIGACLMMSLMFTQAALAQEDSPAYTARGAATVPINPDGTCPEGFVNVNAPLCAEESPNTPGRIFGYGEGDLATQPSAPEVTPATTVTTPAAQPDAPQLPATGGASLAMLAAGAMLICSGIVIGAINQRR